MCGGWYGGRAHGWVAALRQQLELMLRAWMLAEVAEG
jgi:hypothetical protein